MDNDLNKGNLSLTNEEIIIAIIKKNPRASRKDFAVAIGKSLSTVAKILSHSKRIKRMGSTIKGYWVVLDGKDIEW